MASTLTVIAWLVAFGSWFFVSLERGPGVAGIAFACLLAIVAHRREKHQRALLLDHMKTTLPATDRARRPRSPRPRRLAELGQGQAKDGPPLAKQARVSSCQTKLRARNVALGFELAPVEGQPRCALVAPEPTIAHAFRDGAVRYTPGGSGRRLMTATTIAQEGSKGSPRLRRDITPRAALLSRSSASIWPPTKLELIIGSLCCAV